MSVALTVNSVVFDYPEEGDVDWGSAATDWAVAVTQGMLQKAGGLFTLTADADFGASFGLKSIYYKSRTANPATSGTVRFAVTDTLDFRNNANDANLALAVNGANQLTFDGNIIATGSAGDVTGPGSATDNAVVRFDSTTGKLIQNSLVIVSDSGSLTGVQNVTASGTFQGAHVIIGSIAGVVKATAGSLDASALVNADVDAAAAIVYSKLSLTGGIVNADVNASAAIAYSKLVLTGSIVNADVAAGIDAVKIANGSVSNTEFQLLDGLTSLKTLTNWTSWTPTGTFTTNTTYAGQQKRVGDTAMYRVNLAFTGAPTMTGTKFILNLPASETIDTTKLIGDTAKDLMIPGLAFLRDDSGSGSPSYPLLIKYETTTSVSFYVQSVSTYVLGVANGSGRFTATLPVTIATDDSLTLNFEVPIVEFA